MYEKEFPRESMYTMARNSCISVDGDSFIWTSTYICICRYKKEGGEDQEWTKPNIIENQIHGQRMIWNLEERRNKFIEDSQERSHIPIPNVKWII